MPELDDFERRLREAKTDDEIRVIIDEAAAFMDMPTGIVGNMLAQSIADEDGVEIQA